MIQSQETPYEITLVLPLDHAVEVLLAIRLRNRVVPCGTRQRLLSEVDSAMRHFISLAELRGVPADGCCTPPEVPEKVLDLREKGQGF